MDNMVEIGVQTDIFLNHLNHFSTNDLQDKKQMKRELFLESVMKDDESSKFYTGIYAVVGLFQIYYTTNILKECFHLNDKDSKYNFVYVTSVIR